MEIDMKLLIERVLQAVKEEIVRVEAQQGACQSCGKCARSEPEPPTGACQPALALEKKLVTERVLKDALQEGYTCVQLPKGAIVTALAKDYAQAQRMTLQP